MNEGTLSAVERCLVSEPLLKQGCPRDTRTITLHPSPGCVESAKPLHPSDSPRLEDMAR
ncbi:hypothetical protein NITHO_3810005 [Nitrolancea hollandica Lb]|uniref:Uncharacterized protein n=1 Tax=Nitrolancea hollandica Lb TaxID=1129897 RepID=I4EJ42_9BACT|nr:hypothetical protein NITHO_3810005 [Nitrolancea hollandica Lb]